MGCKIPGMSGGIFCFSLPKAASSSCRASGGCPARLSRTMEKLGAARSFGLTSLLLHGLHDHAPNEAQVFWCFVREPQIDLSAIAHELLKSKLPCKSIRHLQRSKLQSHRPTPLAFMTAAPRLRICRHEATASPWPQCTAETWVPALGSSSQSFLDLFGA